MILLSSWKNFEIQKQKQSLSSLEYCHWQIHESIIFFVEEGNSWNFWNCQGFLRSHAPKIFRKFPKGGFKNFPNWWPIFFFVFGSKNSVKIPFFHIFLHCKEEEAPSPLDPLLHWHCYEIRKLVCSVNGGLINCDDEWFLTSLCLRMVYFTKSEHIMSRELYFAQLMPHKNIQDIL